MEYKVYEKITNLYRGAKKVIENIVRPHTLESVVKDLEEGLRSEKYTLEE